MEQMQKLEKGAERSRGKKKSAFRVEEPPDGVRSRAEGTPDRVRSRAEKERFAALGFDVRSDKMPDLKELLGAFDQMTKPQLPTNWLMRLTTKRYLRAYPHLRGTHHASLKKEEKR